MAMYLLGSNIKALNIMGLILTIIGSILLGLGSPDNFNPPIWNDGQNKPPNLKRDWRHLLKKDYGLRISDATENYLTYLADDFYAKGNYPVLRLIAAEFGPYLLLIGFAFQFFAAIDP